MWFWPYNDQILNIKNLCILRFRVLFKFIKLRLVLQDSDAEDLKMPWPILWLLLFADDSSAKNNSTIMPSESVPSSTMKTSDVKMQIIDDSQESACIDIKVFLWNEHSDYTSLPSTMSVFAVIYTLIVTLVFGITVVQEIWTLFFSKI